MAQDAADLAVKHTNKLPADRNGNAGKPFDREAERMLLIHRRDIIEPVEIGYGLKVGLIFDQLLRATVEKADMWIDALYELTVELEDHTQHAVCGWVLRTEIECEIPV